MLRQQYFPLALFTAKNHSGEKHRTGQLSGKQGGVARRGVGSTVVGSGGGRRQQAEEQSWPLEAPTASRRSCDAPIHPPTPNCCLYFCQQIDKFCIFR